MIFFQAAVLEAGCKVAPGVGPTQQIQEQTRGWFFCRTDLAIN